MFVYSIQCCNRVMQTCRSTKSYFTSSLSVLIKKMIITVFICGYNFSNDNAKIILWSFWNNEQFFTISCHQLFMHRYAYWPYGVFKRLGVPGPKPIPFFGTMLAYRRVRTKETKIEPNLFSCYLWVPGPQIMLCLLFNCIIPVPRASPFLTWSASRSMEKHGGE